MAGKENSVMRLLMYKDSLKKLRALGFFKVFSDNLADITGVSTSIVRKDFSLFNITGNKRGGYQIDDLAEQLNYILGRNRVQKVVIIGAGKLGSALMNYRGFDEEQIRILAAFDSAPDKQNPDAPIPVLPMKDLKDYVAENDINLGIITVPQESAQRVVDYCILIGIKGILNFAPLQVHAPKSCVVRNVNLVLELENLIYLLSNKECENDDESSDAEESND